MNSALMQERFTRLAFAIAGTVHLRLRDDPLSSFSGVLSWGLIDGAACVGAAYILLAWRQRHEIRPHS
jgi:hypothetical protein